MLYEICIPNCYLWLAKGAPNSKQIFINYVNGYVKKSYPEMRLVRIRGMKAICERREDCEERPETNKTAKNRTKRSRTKS